MTLRTEEEIQTMMGEALEAGAAVSTKFPEHSYEDGVAAALEWALCAPDSHPLKDGDDVPPPETEEEVLEDAMRGIEKIGVVALQVAYKINAACEELTELLDAKK